MNRLNQQRLIRLRLQRGLAVRQLARDCGIEIAVLNRLETGDNPSLATMSVAALTRVADRLGVPVGVLFTHDPSNTTPEEAINEYAEQARPDAATLGALLTVLQQETLVVVLADALDWDTERVHQAAATLNDLLRPTGTTVFKHGGLMSIKPLDDSHSDAELAVRRHPRAKANQRLATPARARILYQAAREPISPHSLSKRDRINIAVLLGAGLLVENETRKYVPALDVELSLDPLGQPRRQVATEVATEVTTAKVTSGPGY